MRCLVSQKRNVILQSAVGDALQVCLHIVPGHLRQFRNAEAHQGFLRRCPLLLRQGFKRIVAKGLREGVHNADSNLPGRMDLHTSCFLCMQCCWKAGHRHALLHNICCKHAVTHPEVADSSKLKVRVVCLLHKCLHPLCMDLGLMQIADTLRKNIQCSSSGIP